MRRVDRLNIISELSLDDQTYQSLASQAKQICLKAQPYSIAVMSL